MFLDLTSTLTLDKIQVNLLSIDEPSRAQVVNLDLYSVIYPVQLI